MGAQGGALGRRGCVPLPAWAVARPGGSVGMPELFRRLPLMLRNRTLVFVGDAHSAALHLDLAWAVEVNQLRVSGGFLVDLIDFFGVSLPFILLL